MKTNLRLISAWAAMACAASAQVPAQPAGAVKAATKPVFRNAATHEQLALGLRKAQQEDPMKTLKKTEGQDPSVTNRPPSILENSDIVCFNGDAVLIPKRAILQVPRNVSERMKMQPGAKFRSWTEFYAMNRGWITTVEVSRLQAEGNAAIAEDTKKQMDQMAKIGNLIIATYQGGPISVLPLKVPETPAAGSTAATPTANFR